MSARAFITGLQGLSLTDAERSFLREADPWGLILFARNINAPDQVRALTAEARSVLGRDAVVFVDQEGGRVQRLAPPHWPKRPPGSAYAELWAEDPARGEAAVRDAFMLMASEARELGITALCAPVLDVPQPGADPIIGDRAYGETPEAVTAMGRAVLEGLAAGGAAGVIKHIPGHGRADADSHLALPRVETSRADLEATDFAPFRALNTAAMAMTAHVVYTALDPDQPATTSVSVIAEVIRGHIGFDGLLMSDDLSMKALSGTMGARCDAALAAGCDMLLHCNGALEEMQEVAAAAPALEGSAGRRADAAMTGVARTPFASDNTDERAACEQRLAEALARTGWSAHA